jgi:vacuolar-type H+-ATPase subunit C/Vma6
LEESKALQVFSATEYKDYVIDCFDAKNKGLPYSVAEKIRDGYEVAYFNEIKYDLKRNEPFLYYVFRRRIENANVRILFVCLLAGLEESEIKKRLRAV